MRADAQRNHDRVVGAACECFSEGGLDVSVDEIARRAGVGHGTVFRRFPTKDALVVAVVTQEIERMLARAREALDQEDAGTAFETFFRIVADGYARNRSLVEGYGRCAEDLPQKAALREIAVELVRRAQQAGALRRDVGADEIFELVPAASRFPDVILAGLRAPASV